jgi:hypothetical protein
MSSDDALRFLAYEASFCRDRDSAEALCLVLPPLLRYLELQPMDGYTAEEFKRELKIRLHAQQIETWKKELAAK